MFKLLMVLSAITGVITLVLVGTGHTRWAMAGVVITLVLGSFQAIHGNHGEAVPRGRVGPKEESDAE